VSAWDVDVGVEDEAGYHLEVMPQDGLKAIVMVVVVEHLK
jgi:hypothetical protein